MIIYPDKLKVLGSFFSKNKDAAKIAAYLKAQDLFSEEIYQVILNAKATSPFISPPGERHSWAKISTQDKITDQLSYDIPYYPNYVVYPFNCSNVTDEIVELGVLGDAIDPDERSFEIDPRLIFVVKNSDSSINADYLLYVRNTVSTDLSNMTLYAEYYSVNKFVLFKKFGAVVGHHKKEDSLEYLIELRALWTALISQRSKENLASAVNAILGLPIAYEDGIVKNYDASVSMLTVEYPNFGVVDHIYPRIIPRSVGSIVKAYEPLTDYVEVYDAFDVYPPGYLASASQKIASPKIETRHFVKNGYSYIYLSYLDANKDNIVLINDSFLRNIVDVVEESFTFGPSTFSGKYAKVNQIGFLSHGELITAEIHPSYDQLYTYSKKMFFVVKVTSMDIPFYKSEALNRFAQMYEGAHQWIVLIYANVSMEDDVNIDDSQSYILNIDLTERTNRYIFQTLGGDAIYNYDILKIQQI